MGGALAFGNFAGLGSVITVSSVEAASGRFVFDAIPTNNNDAITVPSGYKADVVVRWGGGALVWCCRF